MSIEHITDERAAFEKWASNDGAWPNNIARVEHSPGEYANHEIQSAWTVWQASRAALRTAAQPASATAVEPICPACNGSGEGAVISGGGPDAYDVACVCQTCNGHGLVGGHMADGSGYGERCPDCNPEPAAQPVGEPVYWEWRHLSTHPDTVDFGRWSEWKRVERRSALHTVEDALAEFRAYIAQGYKYELRALYARTE